jgi:hypothetical protein
MTLMTSSEVIFVGAVGAATTSSPVAGSVSVVAGTTGTEAEVAAGSVAVASGATGAAAALGARGRVALAAGVASVDAAVAAAAAVPALVRDDLVAVESEVRTEFADAMMFLYYILMSLNMFMM